MINLAGMITVFTAVYIIYCFFLEHLYVCIIVVQAQVVAVNLNHSSHAMRVVHRAGGA